MEVLLRAGLPLPKVFSPKVIIHDGQGCFHSGTAADNRTIADNVVPNLQHTVLKNCNLSFSDSGGHIARKNSDVLFSDSGITEAGCNAEKNNVSFSSSGTLVSGYNRTVGDYAVKMNDVSFSDSGVLEADHKRTIAGNVKNSAMPFSASNAFEAGCDRTETGREGETSDLSISTSDCTSPVLLDLSKSSGFASWYQDNENSRVSFDQEHCGFCREPQQTKPIAENFLNDCDCDRCHSNDRNRENCEGSTRPEAAMAVGVSSPEEGSSERDGRRQENDPRGHKHWQTPEQKFDVSAFKTSPEFVGERVVCAGTWVPPQGPPSPLPPPHPPTVLCSSSLLQLSNSNSPRQLSNSNSLPQCSSSSSIGHPPPLLYIRDVLSTEVSPCAYCEPRTDSYGVLFPKLTLKGQCQDTSGISRDSPPGYWRRRMNEPCGVSDRDPVNAVLRSCRECEGCSSEQRAAGRDNADSEASPQQSGLFRSTCTQTSPGQQARRDQSGRENCSCGARITCLPGAAQTSFPVRPNCMNAWRSQNCYAVGRTRNAGVEHCCGQYVESRHDSHLSWRTFKPEDSPGTKGLDLTIDNAPVRSEKDYHDQHETATKCPNTGESMVSRESGPSEECQRSSPSKTVGYRGIWTLVKTRDITHYQDISSLCAGQTLGCSFLPRPRPNAQDNTHHHHDGEEKGLTGLHEQRYAATRAKIQTGFGFTDLSSTTELNPTVSSDARGRSDEEPHDLSKKSREKAADLQKTIDVSPETGKYELPFSSRLANMKNGSSYPACERFTHELHPLYTECQLCRKTERQLNNNSYSKNMLFLPRECPSPESPSLPRPEGPLAFVSHPLAFRQDLLAESASPGENGTYSDVNRFSCPSRANLCDGSYPFSKSPQARSYDGDRDSQWSTPFHLRLQNTDQGTLERSSVVSQSFVSSDIPVAKRPRSDPHLCEAELPGGPSDLVRARHPEYLTAANNGDVRVDTDSGKVYLHLQATGTAQRKPALCPSSPNTRLKTAQPKQGLCVSQQRLAQHTHCRDITDPEHYSSASTLLHPPHSSEPDRLDLVKELHSFPPSIESSTKLEAADLKPSLTQTLSAREHRNHTDTDSEGRKGKRHGRQGVKRRRARLKTFQCSMCPVACSNRGQLQGHLRTHTGERPFKCKEPGCNKTFVRNEELTRHRRIHSGERPYSCSTCGKAFTRKDHLNKHVRMHSAEASLGGPEPMDFE